MMVFGLFLRRRNLWGLAVLAAGSVIFRHELLTLLIVNMLMHSGFKLKGLGPGTRAVIMAMLGSLIVCLCVDSYFWGHFIVPEWSVFKYNIIEKKSSIYGVFDVLCNVCFRLLLGIGTFLRDY